MPECDYHCIIVKSLRGLIVLFLLLVPFESFTQSGDLSAEELKTLSLEELMNLEVTSVSKRPEKLTEVASAIQVITQDDIRRSGATSIPEALRLASNLQVAQLNSSAWIISARGFNALFSNKLLVMIDGRTVYSPLFAGVFWDVQNVLLEDIDRIEVISGPGGSVWGANAVNGVINIITKNAGDTQGLFASAGVGSYLRRNASLRYGGKLGEKFSYRIYGMHADRDNTFSEEGTDKADAWDMSQTGVSLDWSPSEKDLIVAHGNFYTGTHNNTPSNSDVDGQNIVGTWSHHFGKESMLVLQGYYDRTWRRDIPSTISDQMETYDLDIDHNFRLARRHNVVWGVGYRFIHDETQNSTEFIGFIPAIRDMDLFSAFAQDEISLANERLKLIVGTKVQHHVYSDFEIQPSVRLAWVASQYTLWAGVSRAVRAPSRIDVDYFLPTYPVPSNQPNVAGGPEFTSEKVVAWELGYRFQPYSGTLLSVSAFYNQYNDLYSVESLPNTVTYQIMNGTEGNSHGVEFSSRVQVTPGWRLRAGYSYFHKDLNNKPGHVYDFSALGNDAENRVFFHSMLDLPANFEFDFTFRYLDPLPKPKVHDYLTVDARIAWIYKSWEVAVIGKNLWEDRHQEYSAHLPSNIYGNIACRF